ncbi:MAG: cyclase family protein [Prevotellaceae bacterium]|nr:cyclase family protein [Prevotellaceae bacterium]
MALKKIYDISLPLTVNTKVFPGDMPLQYNFVQHIEAGDKLNLSEFLATTHIGTHVDAPLHYLEQGKAIGELDLDIFIGTCQLVKVDTTIKTSILPGEITRYGNLPERVLFCTTSENKYDEWTDSYRIPSIELIDYLNRMGVKLIGIDTPSVDMVNASDALIHKYIFKCEMLIIENLYLNEVPEGRYELIALPLKFMELEASPVRVILRSL